MIEQPIHPRPVRALINIVIALLVVGCVLLLGEDLQRSDALQQALDVATQQQAQARTQQTERHVATWAQLQKQHPDLLPELNHLGRALDPQVYLLMVQAGDGGTVNLRVKTAQLDDAFAYVDRLRALARPAVIERAQAPSDGTAPGFLVNISIANKK